MQYLFQKVKSFINRGPGYTGWYFLLFALLALVNRFPLWLSLPPASIHQWRQADGASIARQYAADARMGEVRIYNLFPAADLHACGEFPGLYWLAGMLERLGVVPYPLRWLGLFLLIFAGWCVGWLLWQKSRHQLISAFGAVLFLTSPVLTYYGPNTLPDAPAFCFLPMMLVCLYQADKSGSMRWWLLAGFSASFAILLKVSMAILPLALVITWLWDNINSSRRMSGSRSRTLPVWIALGVLCVVACFQYWMAVYNAKHHSSYFLAATRPIWQYESAFILETLRQMAGFVAPVFASAGLYLFLFLLLPLVYIHRTSIARWKQRCWHITLSGCIAYWMLWFRMFREHDYYSICLLVAPMLLLLEGLPLALNRFGVNRVLLILICCLLLGLFHNDHVMSKRIQLAWQPDNSLYLPVSAFLQKQEIQDSGIPERARMICPEDPSPNISLFALRRSGWTRYSFRTTITADTLLYYQQTHGLTHLALRDTSLYAGMYRTYFPIFVWSDQGWYVFACSKE